MLNMNVWLLAAFVIMGTTVECIKFNVLYMTLSIPSKYKFTLRNRITDVYLTQYSGSSVHHTD